MRFGAYAFNESMLFSLLLPPLVALLLTVHLGYAWTRLVLPEQLLPYRALLTAPAGLALLILVTSALTTTTSLTPPVIAALLALAALPLNVWAWRKNQEPGTENQEPRTRDQKAETRNQGRETNISMRFGSRFLVLGSLVPILCLLVFILAILPPLRWGLGAPIGSNWDAAEFYVPLGRALQLSSQRDLSTLARNPLIQILTTPPVSGRIHGFSYLHATVSSATGVDPLRSYAAVMAFVVALQPLGMYVLGRVLNLGRGAALLGTAMLALGWMPLWVAYNNFSNHALALPLLPIALAASVVALAYGGWRAIAAAALFAAALATAYFPAMSGYIALFAPAAIWLLLYSTERVAVAGRGLALAGAAFVLSLPAQNAFWLKEGFLEEIRRRNTGFQIVEWVSLDDALGLAATFNREQIANHAGLVTAGLVCAAALALAVLVSRRYPLLPAMLLGAAAYAAYTGLDGYYYGFYKGITFALPLLALLLAAGVETLASGTRLRIARGVAAVAVSALLLGLQAATVWQLQQGYTAAGPQLWSAGDLAAQDVAAQVPPGASVLIVAPPDRPPTFTSLLAYALLGHELRGRITTGYTTIGDTGSNILADAALMPESEAPSAHGYSARQLGWSGSGLRLYRRDSSVWLHRAFTGALPLAPGATLRLQLGADAIALENEEAPPHGPPARLTLAAGSFGPASIGLRSSTQTEQSFTLQGGLAELTSAPLQGWVELANTGAEPIYLQWAELRDPAAEGGGVVRDDVFVQTLPAPDAAPGRAAVDLRLHTQTLPAARQKLTGLLVVSHTAPGSEAQQAGQWVFFPSAEAPLRVEMDLATLQAGLSAGGTSLELPGSGAAMGDGAYELDLLLANNASIVYATRLWSWRVAGGAVLDAAGDSVLCDLVSLPQPAVELALDSDDASLRLRGYTLAGTALRPGSTFGVDLVWQSLRHVAGDMQARAVLEDGSGGRLAEQTLPIGAPSHGTSTWQEGELAEQSFSLTLPASAQAGPAMLRVELLGPDGSSRPLGELAELSIEH